MDIEDPKDEKKIENSLKSLFLDHMFTSSSSTVPGVNGKFLGNRTFNTGILKNIAHRL